MPAPARKTPPVAPRAPLQARGQRRVDAILDAAARLVAEHGVAGVTVHGVAREARTAIGSMYHFFPDLEAVLGALETRHAERFAARLAAVDVDSIEWGALPLDAAVAHFLEPILDYVRTNADALRVSRRPGRYNRKNPRTEALMLRIAQRLVAGRDPDAAPGDASTRAVTVLAMLDGVLSRTERAAAPPTSVLLRELERAIVGYLGTFEPGSDPGA